MGIKDLKEVNSIAELRERKDLHRQVNQLIGLLIVIIVTVIVFALFSLLDTEEVTTGSKSMESGISVTEFKGLYDGFSHGVTVSLSGEATNARVSFGEKSGKCNKSELTYKSVGSYTVYYEVKKYGYKTVSGKAKIIIIACPLEDSDIVLTETDTVSYDGSSHSIEYSVVANDMLLNEGEDYELSVDSDATEQSRSGEYTIKVVGLGNYKGYAEQSWSIVKGKLPEYRIEDYRAEYDGASHTGSISVPDGSKATISYVKADGTGVQTEAPSFSDIGVHVCRAIISEEGCETCSAAVLVIICEKEVIIHIDAASKNAGEKDPEFTYTVTGLCEGDELKDIILSRNQGEEVGSYSITARELKPGISNVNYSVGVENAELVISSSEGGGESALHKLITKPVFVIIITVITIFAVCFAVYMVRRLVRRRRT